MPPSAADEFLSPGARRDLRGLGIPDEEHSVRGLEQYFPKEFKIEYAHFELDTLAAVLIHLVKHGLIKLPHKVKSR